MSNINNSNNSALPKHICLICGSHTNLILNIFEPRNGPNIIDIIYAKFKFNAEDIYANEFICYSCNNWLINWYSLQNKNELSENRNDQLPEDDKGHASALYESRLTRSPNISFKNYFKDKDQLPNNNNKRNGSKIIKKKKYFSINHKRLAKILFFYKNYKLLLKKSSQLNKKLKTNIIGMLKRQGTMLYKENEYKNINNNNNNNCINKVNICDKIIKNEKDEIILKFDKVITEVLPIDLLTNSNSNLNRKDKVFDYKLPDSLSITLR